MSIMIWAATPTLVERWQADLNRIPPIILISLGVFGGLMLLLLFLGKVPLKYNLRNLSVRWRTSLMTALAFTMVLFLLTVMMAFVSGMEQLTNQSGQPGNVLVMSQGTTDEAFSNLGFSDLGDIASQPGILRNEKNEPLCSKETYLVVNQPIENTAPGRPNRRFLQLRGLEDPVLSGQVHGVELYPGGAWFSTAGVRAQDNGGLPAIEVVIGEGVARELGNDRTPEVRASAKNPKRLDTGDTFNLADRTWLVVGVMKSSGSTFDSEVWGKQSIIGPKFGKSQFTSLVLRTADEKQAQKVKYFFNNDYSKAQVAAQTEKDYFASLSGTNQQFLIAIIFVTVVLAIGGVFGVMNTMFAAISQRTKDIGVLQLLGFGKGQILMSFLLESMVIALVGGLLGCALGSLSHGWTASSIVSSGQGGGGKFVVLHLTVDATTLASGLMLSLAMGTLGGLFPAWSAVRLKALDALR